MSSPTRTAADRALIVTLTMNPALDITTNAPQVRSTDKIRCGPACYDAGGGGINVARFAHALGASVSAVFPAGGPTGGLITDLMSQAGVPCHRILIAESTRESFTVNDERSGQQYRFVLPGPNVTFAEQTQCLDELRDAARSAEFVVASGSLPPGAPADFYQRVADICRELGVLLVLDTSGGGLRHITSGVFLLKPSVRELRECCGRALATEWDQLNAAHQLIGAGVAQAVLLSLGSEGALLATPHHTQRFPAIPVHAVSGVGAGDAMVAAAVVGLTRGWPLSKSVRFGIAAGAAKLTTPGTETCTCNEIERLFELAVEPTDVGPDF
jgi:6-phosphofructokinase 2